MCIVEDQMTCAEAINGTENEAWKRALAEELHSFEDS